MTMRLDDGYQTLITVKANVGPDFEFWEVSVTPPGIEGGAEINTTTMRNNAIHTKSPQSLYDLSEMSIKVAWNPEDDVDLVTSIINANTVIRIDWPDTDFMEFWGYVKEFKKDEMKIGERPMGDVKIVATNHNNTLDADGAWVEQEPTINATQVFP